MGHYDDQREAWGATKSKPMQMDCPHCRRLSELVADYEKRLKELEPLEGMTNVEDRLRSELNLRPAPGLLLAILYENLGFVGSDRIVTVLASDRARRFKKVNKRRDPDSLDEANVKVHMCRLRKIIGYDAVITGDGGGGYRLSPEFRMKIKALLEGANHENA